MDKNTIIDVIKANQQQLIAFGTNHIGIFGSYITGQAIDKSDIDIHIEFEKGKKSFKNYTGAYLLLKDILKQEIDFITPESLSPYIGPHILKEVEYCF